jgi:hypothetical protein
MSSSVYFGKLLLALDPFSFAKFALWDALAFAEGVAFGVDGRSSPNFEKRASSSESSYDGGLDGPAGCGRFEGVDGKSAVDMDGCSSTPSSSSFSFSFSYFCSTSSSARILFT